MVKDIYEKHNTHTGSLTVRNQYASLFKKLSPRQAGILSPVGNEKPTIIRRRLSGTAKSLGTSLIIKRAGEDIYFWREDGGEEQPSRKRRYTRREKRQEETAEQYFSEVGELEQAVPEEESPELGQTEETGRV